MSLFRPHTASSSLTPDSKSLRHHPNSHCATSVAAKASHRQDKKEPIRSATADQEDNSSELSQDKMRDLLWQFTLWVVRLMDRICHRPQSPMEDRDDGRPRANESGTAMDCPHSSCHFPRNRSGAYQVAASSTSGRTQLWRFLLTYWLTLLGGVVVLRHEDLNCWPCEDDRSAFGGSGRIMNMTPSRTTAPPSDYRFVS